MKKTVLCHIYNEEWLLPRWLNHHSKMFDQLIMIDYESNDNSIKIIDDFRKVHRDKTIIIVGSDNKDFGAMNVDLEIERWERSIEGWKMCLNITEFLHGDFSKCIETPSQHVIPSFMVVDNIHYYVSPTNLDFDKANTGIPHWVWNERAGRSFHNFNIDYPKPGRHYFVDPSQYSKDFMIFHYGWYPMCPATLSRKIQIQTQIPETDKNNRLGWHHITTKEALLKKWTQEYITKAEDHTDYLNSWRNLTNGTR